MINIFGIVFVSLVCAQSDKSPAPSLEENSKLIISVSRAGLVNSLCSGCRAVDKPLSFDGVGVVSEYKAVDFKRSITIGIYGSEALAEQAGSGSV